MGDDKIFVHANQKRAVGLASGNSVYILNPTGLVHKTDLRSTVREISTKEAFMQLRKNHNTFLLANEKRLQKISLEHSLFKQEDEFDRKELVYDCLVDERSKYFFPKRISQLRASRDTKEAVIDLTKEIIIPDVCHYLVNYYGLQEHVELRTAFLCHTANCDIPLLEDLMEKETTFPFEVEILPVPNNKIVRNLFSSIPYQKSYVVHGKYTLAWQNEIRPY